MLCATASDLVRWEDVLSSGRALSSAALDAMHEKSVVRSEGSTVEVDYGFGRGSGLFRGHRKIGHADGEERPTCQWHDNVLRRVGQAK